MPPKTDGATVAKPVLSSNTSAVADGHESRKTGVGAAPAIQMFDFEVFGRVQHVSMRKYTKDFADRVGVVGWVKNTEDETVIGQAAGVETAMVRFRKWLETKGSPSAAITRAEFSNECIIAQAIQEV
eukprot:m.119735 g.119735  ORF g.119735 m.119735 type:complete len:127 (+) comp13312_c0_seq1:249-629(+)